MEIREKEQIKERLQNLLPQINEYAAAFSSRENSSSNQN